MSDEYVRSGSTQKQSRKDKNRMLPSHYFSLGKLVQRCILNPLFWAAPVALGNQIVKQQLNCSKVRPNWFCCLKRKPFKRSTPVRLESLNMRKTGQTDKCVNMSWQGSSGQGRGSSVYSAWPVPGTEVHSADERRCAEASPEAI